MVIASKDSSSPARFTWEDDNSSCAYDALFTVLYDIWSTDTKLWTRRSKEINQHHLMSLSACFKKQMNGQTSFKTARNTIRHELHSQSPAQFSHGTRGTGVVSLTSAILAPDDFLAISSPECTSCEYVEPTMNDRLQFMLYEKGDTPKSTCQWLGSLSMKLMSNVPTVFLQ